MTRPYFFRVETVASSTPPEVVIAKIQADARRLDIQIIANINGIDLMFYPDQHEHPPGPLVRWKNAQLSGAKAA